MLRRFFQKVKRIFSIVLIIVLLPYIVTIFMNGGAVETGVNKASGADALLEEYCISTLAKEVSSDYEQEMLKVQAVLVRTTIYGQVEKLGEAIFEEDSFQKREKPDAAWYQTLREAWEQTEGEVIMQGEKLALVPFHQVSNGKTRVGEEVLGSKDYPYLQIKECPKDVEAENQMESKFIKLTGATVKKVDSAGYVLSVKVGEETVSGESFRDTYGLASSCFELQAFETQTRVITKGVGHGLGLSQYTANEMAKEGKTYQEILQYFFEGTEIKEVAEILWNVE